jgi:hypothetical protein
VHFAEEGHQQGHDAKVGDGEADAGLVQGAKNPAEEGENLGLPLMDDGVKAEAAGQDQHQG